MFNHDVHFCIFVPKIYAPTAFSNMCVKHAHGLDPRALGPKSAVKNALAAVVLVVVVAEGVVLIGISAEERKINKIFAIHSSAVSCEIIPRFCRLYCESNQTFTIFVILCVSRNIVGQKCPQVRNSLCLDKRAYAVCSPDKLPLKMLASLDAGKS